MREPVQVYLDPADRERLNRLTDRLEMTKSDVLRKGLAALEALEREDIAKGTLPPAPLPTFSGRGLRSGVDLDDTAALLDLMEGRGAPD